MGRGKDDMRGLTMFIAEIRNCRSKEDEIKRVSKEFSNIRDKFSNSRSLNTYNKRKYLSKLVFCFLLGYDVDFGYMEAVSLILSNKFIDKKIAFLFLSIMISPDHSAQKVIRKSIRTELESSDPVFRSVSLEAITNMASFEMAKEFSYSVLQVLISPNSADSNKQCSAICLLALFRCNTAEMDHLSSNSEWRDQLIQLLQHSNLSLVSSAIHLLTFLCNSYPADYQKVVPLAVNRLGSIVNTASTNQLPDLRYHQVAAPFITVSLLKLLQTQNDFRAIESTLTEILRNIHELTIAQRSKQSQHINAKHAIFFEAANLAVNAGMVEICQLYQSYLMELLTWELANYRHCSLVVLTSMSSIPSVFGEIKRSRKVFINLLKNEPDNSVKRSAISLLCAMCTKSDVESIVGELLEYLSTATFEMREGLVLKIAVLCEQFALESKWYVDTVVSLMISDGDLIGQEICFRVINIIMQKPDLQKYSVDVLFKALGSNSLHENLVVLIAYVVGEFAHLASVQPQKLLAALHEKFFLCSPATQYQLISTYAKLVNVFPVMASDVLGILEAPNIYFSPDVELQKRAVEYSGIIKSSNQNLLNQVFEEMPFLVKVEDEKSPSAHSLLDEAEDPPPLFLQFSNISVNQGVAADPHLLIRKFLTSDSGCLFDGEDCSVSLHLQRSTTQFHNVDVSLVVASKGPRLDAVLLLLPDSLKNGSLRIKVAQTSQSVESCGQLVFRLQVTCVCVFRSPLPNIVLEYMRGSNKVKVPICIPITVGKFFVSQNIEASVFFNRWGKIPESSQYQKVLSMMSSRSVLFSEMGKFGISHLPLIDPNSNNFVGSTVFYSESQCIGILVRMEAIGGDSSTEMRLTAKYTAKNQELLEELQSLIQTI